MDISSKLMSEVDSGLCLENISKSLSKVPYINFMESLFQNLLLRQKDLAMYCPGNHKTLGFEIAFS